MPSDDADILHVDLDAFYASVERQRRADLERRPVIVGGRGARGVVLSCSYDARASGVRNGMPGMRARRLCPEAVFVAPDFEAYGEASRAFREILEAHTPLVEPMSLDEAFCDVSGAHALFGTSEEIASRIRATVRGQLGLVCSVGGGRSKVVAKIASRAAKPDGALIVRDPVAFLSPLDVGDLWGVGAATAEALRRIGIHRVADVASTPPNVLRRAVGDAAAAHLADLARGTDPRPVTPGQEAKSVGAEETFETDVSNDERVRAEILRLSDRVASRLVARGIAARTITLKIRWQDFETHTRSRTVRTPTNDVWTIFRVARESYDAFRRGRRAVRLVGVTATGLMDGAIGQQMTLERRADYAKAEEAVARVRGRFGRDAVGLARLLERKRDD